VNFCLVPEVPFSLDGGHGLLDAVRARLVEREHAVIVVAEGAASRTWRPDELTRDASGNVKTPPIGAHLARAIEAAGAGWDVRPTVKLIDPSYMIRSVPAGTSDHLLCSQLAQMAAHAAMSGRTGVMIGLLRDEFVHVPLDVACRERKRIDPDGSLWQGVLSSTGQPPLVPPS
jgi:6-phosphofructokinase 1